MKDTEARKALELLLERVAFLENTTRMYPDKRTLRTQQQAYQNYYNYYSSRTAPQAVPIKDVVWAVLEYLDLRVMESKPASTTGFVLERAEDV